MNEITVTDGSTVSVRGWAEIEVAPDFALVAFSVSADAKTADGTLAKATRIATACRTALADSDGVRRSKLSRVRVGETTRWDPKKETHVHAGYNATLSGSAEVEVATVAAVVESIVGAGAQISWVGWDLDRDNPAYREARKVAVADAHRAAVDFADAVGATLGPLATLADPGLLAAGHRVALAQGREVAAMSAGGSTADPDELELDPEPQRVEARVEAVFSLV